MEFRFHAGLQHLLPLKSIKFSSPPGVPPRMLVTWRVLQIIDRHTDISKRRTHRNTPKEAERKGY